MTVEFMGGPLDGAQEDVDIDEDKPLILFPICIEQSNPLFYALYRVDEERSDRLYFIQTHTLQQVENLKQKFGV